ncbi:TPA: hypothetical protein ACF3XZ_004745, partial [Vibrio parahaemolyticus]
QNHVSKLKIWLLIVRFTGSSSLVQTHFQLFQIQSFVTVLAVVLFFGGDRAGQSKICFWLQICSVSLLV